MSTTTDTPKGLRLSVYRNADGTDCTLNGISATHTDVTLIGYITDADEQATRQSLREDVLPQRAATMLPRECRVFTPTDDAPAVLLRYSASLYPNGIGRAIHFIPADLPAGQHVMFGGNYSGVGDTRFGQLTEQLTGYRHYIVPVHDRIES